MRVLFLSPGADMPSTRYRITNMIPYLNEVGIETKLIHPPRSLNALSKGRYLKQVFVGANWADIVYIQAFLKKPRVIRLLRTLCDSVVYDFDDALYTAPPWEENSEERTKHINLTLETASAVITGCPEQSEYASQYCDTVFTLPPAVPQDKYAHVSQRSGEGLDIGWIGTPANIRYLATIEAPLTNLLDANCDIQLKIITADDRPMTPFSERIGEDVHYLTWSLDSELDQMAETDVGIRPLRRDSWSEAKGYISVTQFMGLARPVVVTPIGMLNSLVDHEESGYHASTEQEWTKWLSQLAREPERRIKLGQSARAAVEEHELWEHQRASNLVNHLEEI